MLLSFNQLRKNLKKDFSGFTRVRIAILADSASQFLCQAVKGYGYEVKIDFDVYEADYDQIDGQVSDPNSELYSRRPDFIFINKSSEHLLKRFYKSDIAGRYHFGERIVTELSSYIDTIEQRLNATVIFNTFPEINDAVFGNYAAKVENSFIYQIRKANLLLMELSQKKKGVFICDISGLQADFGYRLSFDPKLYVNGDMIYSLDILPYVAKNITDIIKSVKGVFKKCLILDLDNTLWGGIIGDDGMEGIKIGDLGIGKAYTDFQLWIKQLKQRGIILAVCSKNDEKTAKEPFETHPDMILRLDDIAVFVANWETKVDNIRHIQKVINIGLDSMVFIDDNPFEREIVKSAIPDITVPDMPEDPADYLVHLRRLNLFETASYTEDDQVRTAQYQQEAKRSVFQLSFENEEEFLASLDMQSAPRELSDYSIPRVAQLTQRSNQFNLRTVRYSEGDIKRIASSAGYYCLTFDLKDRFGSHGLIAAVILEKQDRNTLFIDTWIMSCRVLKRGMEGFTLNQLVETAVTNGFSRIVGEYIPTQKNGMVRDHYSKLGFTEEAGKWVLELASFTEKNTFIDKI